MSCTMMFLLPLAYDGSLLDINSVHPAHDSTMGGRRNGGTHRTGVEGLWGEDGAGAPATMQSRNREQRHVSEDKGETDQVSIVELAGRADHLIRMTRSQGSARRIRPR